MHSFSGCRLIACRWSHNTGVQDVPGDDDENDTDLGYDRNWDTPPAPRKKQRVQRMNTLQKNSATGRAGAPVNQIPFDPNNPVQAVVINGVIVNPGACDPTAGIVHINPNQVIQTAPVSPIPNACNYPVASSPSGLCGEQLHVIDPECRCGEQFNIRCEFHMFTHCTRCSTNEIHFSSGPRAP